MDYTEAKKNTDPIRDDEFKVFLEQDFSEKLEEKLLSTEIGKRVKILEKFGLDISIKGMVGKYISQEGYTMDNVGNLYLQEQAMQRIYVSEEAAISESLNVDISKITDLGFLQKVISNVEHRRNVERYGVEAAMDIQRATWGRREDLKGFYDLQKDYAFLFEPTTYHETKSFYNQFNSFYTSTNLIERLSSNPNLKMSREKIENIVNELDKMTVDSNIENKETVQLLRCLYRLREAEKHKEINGELATKTEIQSTLQDMQMVMGEAQYKEIFLNSDGSVNINKAIEFLNNWEVARNDAKIFEELTLFSNTSMSSLTASKLPKILVTLRRAEMSGDEKNQALAIAFANKMREELNINFFNGEKLDGDKIAEFYEKITDGGDIYFEIEQTEWNELTANDKLDRVEDAIEFDLGTSSKSRDQINNSKESMNQLLQQKKENKKIAIEQIIKDGNYSPEQVVALFYEFRYKEIAESGKKLEQFDGRQLWNAKEHGTAEVIMTYMLEHAEQFKDYIKDTGSLNGKKINEFISKNEFSNTDRAGISNAFRMIETTMEAINEKSDSDKKNVISLLEKIEKYRGMLGTDIPPKEKNKLFAEAKKLYATNSLTKAIKRELIRIDIERFKEMRKEVIKETNGNENFSLLKTISDIGKNLGKKSKRKTKKEESEISNFSKLKGKIDTMTKKISEITGKKEADKKEPQSNLPVVKRKSIFDRIKEAFLPKENKNHEGNSEVNVGKHMNNSDKETQNPTFVSENLTGDKKSDTTVIPTSGMDYLKVDYTPTYKQDTSKSEQGNQNRTGELNPEEQEIGE